MMSDIPTITLRARLEMGDRATNFTSQLAGDGVTKTAVLDRKPVGSALTITVTPATGAAYTLTPNVDYTVDSTNGVVQLAAAMPAQSTVQVSGQAYRLFTDSDWQTFILTALTQHLNNRTDSQGQPILLANLPPIEEYLVALLAMCQALYALINDASFDVDISTPEGVHIPRGQRVEQLWHMLTGRQQEYKELCSALNVGLWRVETLNMRRKSLLTNKLVPIYQSQEIWDSRFPRELYPEIATNGLPAGPVPTYLQTIPLVAYSNQDFTTTVTVGQDLTGLQVRASVRRYPQNLTPMARMDVTVLNATGGVVQLHVSALLNYYIGVSKFWDLETIDASGNVKTLVGGTYDAIRQGGF